MHFEATDTHLLIPGLVTGTVSGSPWPQGGLVPAYCPSQPLDHVVTVSFSKLLPRRPRLAMSLGVAKSIFC